jgi:hypothetical protein
MGLGSSWPPAAVGWPAVPLLYGVRDTVVKGKAKTKLYQKSRQDGRSGRDVGRNRKASMEWETEA